MLGGFHALTVMFLTPKLSESTTAGIVLKVNESTPVVPPGPMPAAASSLSVTWPLRTPGPVRIS